LVRGEGQREEEQQAELCKFLAGGDAMLLDGYDVMLLPVALGRAGAHPKPYVREKKITQYEEENHPVRGKQAVQQASLTQHTQSTKPWVPTTTLVRQKLSPEARGNIRG
jgi:hypothetical protein